MIIVTKKDDFSFNLDDAIMFYTEDNVLVVVRKEVDADGREMKFGMLFSSKESAKKAYQKILEEIKKNRYCPNLVIEVEV